MSNSMHTPWERDDANGTKLLLDFEDAKRTITMLGHWDVSQFVVWICRGSFYKYDKSYENGHFVAIFTLEIDQFGTFKIISELTQFRTFVYICLQMPNKPQSSLFRHVEWVEIWEIHLNMAKMAKL